MSRVPVLLMLAVLIWTLPSCHREGDGTAGDTDSTQVEAAGGTDAFAVPATLAKDREATVLRMRFTPGAEFGYAISITQKVTLTRDTLVEKTTQRIRYEYRFSVLDTLPDGAGRVKVTCAAASFSHDYAGGGQTRTMTYNSREKNDASKEKLFAQYSAPLNTPFEIVVEPDGRIASVSSVDAILRRLMGDEYNTTKFDTRQLLERELAEVTLKNVLQIAFQKFEQRPVSVDSSWSITQFEALGYLRIQNKAVYTLKGFSGSGDDETAHVDIRIVTSYVGDKTVDTGQGMATLHGFDVTGSGATAFSLLRGRPDRRSFRQKVFVKFFVEPPAELKQMAPDQAKDFWMTQDAVVENTVERL